MSLVRRTSLPKRAPHVRRGVMAAALWASALAAPGAARDTGQPAAPLPGLPEELVDVSFEQKLGATVPLDLSFRDEAGAEVSLQHFFAARPVVLSLVYHDCPMLCSLALNGLSRSLRVLDLDVGSEFEVVTVSFDAQDTPAQAREAKERYIRQLGRPEAAAGSHFLTGDAEAIESLTASVGFRYVYDERSEQFAHAAGVVVLTPEGVVARYLFGIEYSPRDLRLALVEASAGKVGNVIDQVLLYCFQYDPSTGTYSAMVLKIVRLAGVASLLGFALLFWWLRRRGRGARPAAAAGLPSAAGGGP